MAYQPTCLRSIEEDRKQKDLKTSEEITTAPIVRVIGMWPERDDSCGTLAF